MSGSVCHAAVLLLLAGAGAQRLASQAFSEERHRLLPVGSVATLLPADLDGDGDVDLVWPTPQTLVAWNDGDGRFSVGVPHASAATWAPAVAVGDIDGDGDLDLAFGGYYAFAFVPVPPMLFRNDGGGVFTDVSAQVPPGLQQTVALHFVDYDSDGDLDLVEHNRSMQQFSQAPSVQRLLENDGLGSFTDVTSTAMPNAIASDWHAAVADLDGDGVPEFVSVTRVTSSATEIRVRKRAANGAMTLVPGVFPVSPSWSQFRNVAAADLDQDGDLDVISEQAGGVVWFANQGGLVFGSPTALPSSGRPYPFDLDADGLVDLLCASDRGLTLLRGVGGGAFVDVTASRVEAAGCGRVIPVVFDLDGDGDRDLVAAAQPQACVWHNDGSGRLWQLATHEAGNGAFTDAICADVDGDGWRDLAVITEIESQPRVRFFRGGERGPGLSADELGSFGSGFGLPTPMTLAWIDFDLDGDLDLFVGGRLAGDDRLFRLDPAGFVDATATALPAQSGGAQQVVVADLDGDGFDDLLAPGPRWLHNTGGASFVEAGAAFPASAPNTWASDVAVLDVDLDGDLDVVVAQQSGSSATPARLIRNDGAAGFVDATPALLSALAPSSVATFDVDADGVTDLVFGVDQQGSNWNGVLVVRVTAAGLVDETALRAPPVAPTVLDVVVEDYDGDGRDDVQARRSFQPPLRLRNVNGGLQVHTFGWPDVGDQVLRRPVAADLDGDGDQDLVGTGGTIRNRARDLQDSVPPRLGRPAELVVHARDGDGVTTQVALVFVADQPLAQPVALGSLGRLHIDPAAAGLVAACTFPGFGGECPVAYPVPFVPALLGGDVFVQALFLHQPAPSSWRLSNLLVLRLRA